MDGLYREFGELLRARRKSAGLTQSQVAERVGLQRTSITNIEKGRQHVLLHQLILLAAAVGATPEELLPRQQAALEDLVSASTLVTLRRDNPEEDLAVLRQALNSSHVASQNPEAAIR